MTYKLAVQDKGHYYHFVVTGENTIENVSSYLGEIHKICIRDGCSRVLIEENFEGPGLGTMPIYDIITDIGLQARMTVRKIAFINANPDHDIREMKFAETVAVNRGVNIKVFSNVAEAEEWILSGIGDTQQAKD
nr:hypothetical protein [candidate division Zixibacteria bacterium]